MARAHLCDVPGCGRSRKRWQRLCDRCFAALPGDLRTAIAEAHYAQDKPRWRAARRAAASALASVEQRRATVTPQQAFENTRRLLGEHD